MADAVFDECPACGIDGDWSEEGECIACGYDVLEDSDVAEECNGCGELLEDSDDGVWCPVCEGED